jgi:hypothetical protein
LAAGFVERILKIAKKNMEQDGFVNPVLFLGQIDGRHFVMPLDLPPTAPDRVRFVQALGLDLLAKGMVLQEAVLIMESWMVRRRELTLSIPPSQDPQRQEAIVIIGRNAAKTQTTMVLQPFVRTESGTIVWDEPIADVQTSPSPSNHFTGILDYLFVPDPIGQRN